MGKLEEDVTRLRTDSTAFQAKVKEAMLTLEGRVLTLDKIQKFDRKQRVKDLEEIKPKALTAQMSPAHLHHELINIVDRQVAKKMSGELEKYKSTGV